MDGEIDIENGISNNEFKNGLVVTFLLTVDK